MIILWSSGSISHRLSIPHFRKSRANLSLAENSGRRFVHTVRDGARSIRATISGPKKFYEVIGYSFFSGTPNFDQVLTTFT